MKVNKKIFNRKVKTHYATVAVGILGSLITFLPTVMQFIPASWYGPIFVGIGVLFHILRNVTSKSVDEK